MKLIGVVLMLLTLNGDFNRIAEINRLKKEASEAYAEKKYSEAAVKYHILIDSLGQYDDDLLMNLSHCYFNLNDTSNAISHYKQLTQSVDKFNQSVAWQQLGILDAETQNFSDAIEDFKNALRANPQNEDARYNYELLKKKLKNQDQKDQDKQNNENNEDKNNQQQQNKDQQNQQNQDQKQQEDQQQNNQSQENNKQDQENQDKKSQNQQQKDQQDKKDSKDQEQQQAEQKNDNQENNDKDKSQPMNNENDKEYKISREKAEMILEAMKNTEEQYLQQLKRKAAKKPESGKPDW